MVYWKDDTVTTPTGYTLTEAKTYIASGNWVF
jgi:hypothetical protein